tara:strand:+ start:111 stop:953 length:843 start_codon:yes stop_codon:yes gene_type:complete
MNVIDWAKRVFSSSNIEGKLLSPRLIKDYSYRHYDVDLTSPGRDERIKFSKRKIKFPKINGFSDPKIRARAIAFFANHELEAIEMMCAALIKFGGQKEQTDFAKISRGLVSSIQDEQKHLLMYLNRLEELNSDISSYPLNDFFWKQFCNLNNFEQFFSLMSLTFEAANLDFCLFYERVFQKVGDKKSATMMYKIYLDEIKHVKLGVYWMNKWRNSDSLWEYYLRNLPAQISPDRSKGIDFSIESRVTAGFEESFLKSLIEYDDDFKISKRKMNSSELLQK